MVLVGFILFVSSLNEVCLTMICEVKWPFLMVSGGFEEAT